MKRCPVPIAGLPYPTIILLATTLACGSSSPGNGDADADAQAQAPTDAQPSGDAAGGGDAAAAGDAGTLPSTSPVWDSTEVLSLSITGPLQQAFAGAHAGEPDGIFPPVRDKLAFSGTVEYTGGSGAVRLDATLHVRGNSSLQECPFPKLRVTVFDDIARRSSIFYKAKRTKVGTHCGDFSDDERGTIGRLRNDKAPFREAFIYQVMRLVDMPSKWSRPARITYVDSSVGTDGVGWTVERNAFLFDNAKNVAKRHGATLRPDDAPWTAAEVPRVDRTQAAKIYFLNALIGNWDWRLVVDPATTETGAPWNVGMMTLPGGTHVAFPYDFDLASVVTGEPRRARDLPDELYPTEPILFRQAAYYLLPTKDLFTQALRNQVATFFLAAETEIRAALVTYPMDADGRANMTAHIDAFYAVLTREYPSL